ncbi:MAG: CRISPR-associated endonuclease Cas2 [Anaerolineae bacterium]
MQIVVVYDIPSNRIRTKIADICADYGLERIQYSAFSGDLRRVHQEEMIAKMRKRLGKQAGKIQLFPCCEKDWNARIEVIQQPKKEEQEAKDADRQ